MRSLVFFGSPLAALPSLHRLMEAGHRIELVVTQPDRPSGRGKRPRPSDVGEFARNAKIPVITPARIKKDIKAVERIKSAHPEIIVVVAYGQIIPDSIIYLPPHNSVNLHFSLLPLYRGAAPVQWALYNGETTTGITIFELNDRMDEGDILAQRELSILPGENADELESRLAGIGADLLVEVLDSLETLPRTPQDHSRATLAPLLKRKDGRLNWNRDAVSIGNQVRAFSSWPSSFTFLGHKRIKILKGRLLEKTCPDGRPGEIILVTKEGLVVCCGDGRTYLVERLQPENRKSMDAYAFALGTDLQPGSVFG